MNNKKEGNVNISLDEYLRLHELEKIYYDTLIELEENPKTIIIKYQKSYYLEHYPVIYGSEEKIKEVLNSTVREIEKINYNQGYTDGLRSRENEINKLEETIRKLESAIFDLKTDNSKTIPVKPKKKFKLW